MITSAGNSTTIYIKLKIDRLPNYITHRSNKTEQAYLSTYLSGRLLVVAANLSPLGGEWTIELMYNYVCRPTCVLFVEKYKHEHL